MTENIDHNLPPNDAELMGSMIQGDINRIQGIDAAISQDMGAELHSPELAELSDKFLVEAALDSGSEQDVETALIAGALEATEQRPASSLNPIHALELSGSENAINDAVSDMRDAHATLPNGEDAASVIVEEINKLEAEVVEKWKYDGTGKLIRESIDDFRYSNILIGRPGLIKDTEMAHVVATEVDQVINDQLEMNATTRQEELDKLQAILDQHGELPQLVAAKKASMNDMQNSIDPIRITKGAKEPSDAVRELSIERERAYLMALIQKRIESNLYPWTMQNSELPPKMLEGVKIIADMVNSEGAPLNPTDKFRIPPPMKRIEGYFYAPEDEALLQQAGINLSNRGLHFKREELQKAGVFFINRVGAGEQPIFGVPIPDDSAEDGIFNVQDRTFLTREEFDKVYEYQQKNGYGIGNKDPADVQLDMIMFAVRPDGRKPDTSKSYGFGSRESKYGIARSPFVESGVVIGSGVEPMIYDKKLGKLRMNTMSIHLANGHPDYPGLSEMFSEDAAHDQRYMSSGLFVREYHVPLPTEQEALVSLKYAFLQTKRENFWVGPLPETSRFSA